MAQAELERRAAEDLAERMRLEEVTNTGGGLLAWRTPPPPKHSRILAWREAVAITFEALTRLGAATRRRSS